MKKNLLIAGGSRGIGGAIAEIYHRAGHNVYCISRTQASAGKWIKADLSQLEGIQKIANDLNNVPLDALLFLGGVWENNAFTSEYDFLTSSDSETRFVISVNTIAPIELTRAISPNLLMTNNPKAIYISSLSGLDHLASHEVANTASKFGLRGAVQALMLTSLGLKICFTVINPGNVATEEVINDIQEGRFAPQQTIPIEDVHSTIDWLLSLSPHVSVPEINLIQRRNAQH
jgi:NAD(P)-dependent dehydrogenase (short-subunit alcohol dehydrogenase family)